MTQQSIDQSLELALKHHDAGRLAEAEKIYRQVLATQPDNSLALNQLGRIARQVGQNEMALQLIKRAIALQPDYAEAYNNLGNTYLALGRLPDAVEAYRATVLRNPQNAAALSNLGNALNELKQFEEAEGYCRRAVKLTPKFAGAHVNLGNALYGQERYKESLAAAQLAISLSPNVAGFHNNLGSSLFALKRNVESIAAYQRALSLQPDYAEALRNLGNVLVAEGRFDEAIGWIQKSIQLDPTSTDARNCLGNALVDSGRFAEGIQVFREIINAHPELGAAYSNMGNALRKLSHFEASIAAFENAIRLKPLQADIHRGYAESLRCAGKQDEAIAEYREAIRLKPTNSESHSCFGNALKDRGRLDESIAAYNEALRLEPENFIARANLVYTILFHPGYDAKAIRAELARWDKIVAKPIQPFPAIAPTSASSGRRLRIGYVSPDFRDHVIGRNLIPLFARHDHSAFEIFCYSNVVVQDSMTTQFRQYADQWRKISGLSAIRVAQQIRADQIDILVDLALHMADNSLRTFAHKPAPIQATFAGYPGSTGLHTMDYRITDRYLDPPEMDDSVYSEKSIRLPDSFWCFDPLGTIVPVNGLPAETQGYITFGCLNNFCKVNEGVLRLWAGVMRAVDRSKLILLCALGSQRQDVLSVLSKEGIDALRVEFVESQPREDYLKLYHRIDIGLDTFPYNGHTTSLDSLWMGVPVITRVGSTVVGRAGLSQLTNLGLPELIAENDQQFVSIASGLASDLPRLSSLRATLRMRMESSPLTDGDKFTREIESAFLKMWQAAGAAPR